MSLSRIVLYEAFVKLHGAVLKLQKENVLQVEDALQKRDTKVMLYDGIRKLGQLHCEQPLVQRGGKEVITQNLSLLWYYHNRLTSYALEKFL